MLSVDVDITIDKDASGAIKRAQRHRLEDAMTKGWSVSLERVPEDEGGLRHSGFEPTWRSDGRIEFGFRSDHALPIEKGTQPFHPPLQPLLDWSERKTGDKGLGFYVALHKIPKEGITAQPYAEPGAEAAKQWLKSNDFSGYLQREL